MTALPNTHPALKPACSLQSLSALLIALAFTGLTGCANTGSKNRSASGTTATQPSTNPNNTGSSAGNAVSADIISPALSPDQKRDQEKLLHRKLIGQMMEQGSWFAALAHCDAYDKQWGADVHSRLLRADAQRMTGQLPVAEKGYESLRTTSLRPQALHGLSQVAAQRGQWSQAAGLLAEAIREQPLNPRLYNDQGLVLTLLNKPQEAFVALRKSQELEPDKSLARANLALYAAVYDEEPLFQSMSSQLNWKSGDIQTVKAQALRIRAAHQQGRTPDPDIFSGR